MAFRQQQQQQQQVDCDKHDYLLVAAIDFGTTFSGYAFSTRSDYDSNPLKACCKVWTAGTGCLLSQKTSTCVLFDENKKFHSFGFEAEDKYSDLSDDLLDEGGGKHKKWYFFKRFKMKLFDQMRLKKKFMLDDEMGKKMPALTVFAECILFMKNQLLEDVRRQLPDVGEGEIRWVITVPAIWNDNSKQFMREATEMAKIKGDNLLISLEPEAASLCCRHLPMNTFKGCSSGFLPFAPNSKYLVFDAGGGTIDITVHQVQFSGGLKELYKATGGSWGGTYVDKAFRDLLADIVGNDLMDDFAENKTSDYIDLFREFEVKKRNFKNDMKEKITFKVPNALNESFRKTRGMEIKDHIDKTSQYKGKVNWIGDKLRMEADTAKALFKDACESITKHLRTLFSDERVKDVSIILMVGGFSESPMLQEMLKSQFPKKKIIIPADAGLAVLKGAVIYGHNPALIEERRCRYTYGVKTSNQFETSKHPESKKFLGDDGEEYCGDVFDKHVEIGQPVVYGETQIKQSYSPTKSDQTRIAFPVYASSDKSPQFVTDSCCQQLGTLTIDLEGYGLDRPVEIQMCFSGTELKVMALEKNTGKTKQAKVDFLG